MNKIRKETFTRSDLEISLKKEFPYLTNLQIVNTINVIQDTIIDAVALDERVEIRGFGTFSKRIIRPRRFVNPKTKKISYLGETATMHFKPSKFLVVK